MDESNGNTFTLEANIAGVSDSTLFIIKDSRTKNVLDSSYSINGQIYLNSHLEQGHPKKLLLMASDAVSKEFLYTILFAGNELIKFNCDKKDFPWNIDMSGSLHQDAAEKFNQVEYQRQIITSALKSNPNSEEDLSQKINHASDSLNNIIVKLILEHPNSYAAIDFFKYHKKKFSTEELAALYSRLDSEFRETVEGKAIKLQSEYPNPKVGDKYYDYSAIDQNGDRLALSDIEEKYILLHFSSSACFGSQMSLPELKRLYALHENKLEVVSISEDVAKEQWQNTVLRDSIPWKYLWDGKGEFGDAVVKYWAVGTPNYVLISPGEEILEKWFGYTEGVLQEKLQIHLN